MLHAAYIELITNIIITVPISPTSDVCQVKKMKDGLKFGAPADSNPKHAKFVAK